MFGLVYLTSVAGLIATSAVLHQLNLSRSHQPLILPSDETGLPHIQTSNLSPEAPAAAHRLPCCVLANKSLNSRTGSLETGQRHKQNPTSESAQTSLLSSFFSSGDLRNLEMETPQSWSSSIVCPGCLTALSPVQCRLRNTSALPDYDPLNNHLNSPLSPNLFGAAELSLDSSFGLFPPLNLRPCRPDFLLPTNKYQALLMPG